MSQTSKKLYQKLQKQYSKRINLDLKRIKKVLRKLDNPELDKSFAAYMMALELDPRHRGTHEYIGRLYLNLNQPEKAKMHLDKLDSICFFGCDEYSTLKKAIEDYEKTSEKPTLHDFINSTMLQNQKQSFSNKEFKDNWTNYKKSKAKKIRSKNNI